MCDCEEEFTVVQKLNRTLRTVNKNIRTRLQAKMEEADALFLLYCDTNQKAEEALWEVWSNGKLDCEPDDYPEIARIVVAALKQLNHVSHAPTQQKGECDDCIHAYPGPPCPRHSTP